ncbi:MAG: pyridoxamine 5'-phosphate oxidase family protein [Thermomicrobiales bacterium]|nr:pyridoxamine 5'-phosphate oxidase family protein [Thermomicrobiales bacterium]
MIGILSTAEIEALLTRNRIGRLAMCADARPYVLPVSYRYDGVVVFGFSGSGKKIETMRAQPNVALLVDEILSPTSWKSVVLEGVFEELTEPEERRKAYTALSTNGSAILPRGIMADSGLVFYRIRPVVKSGRFETSES